LWAFDVKSIEKKYLDLGEGGTKILRGKEIMRRLISSKNNNSVFGI
jgi:hypothetical protein